MAFSLEIQAFAAFVDFQFWLSWLSENLHNRGLSPERYPLMPKLNNRPPKYSKIGKYAVCYVNGKKHYLGLHNTPESLAAYSRLIIKIQSNPTLIVPKGESGISVKELVATFLDHAEQRVDVKDYNHCYTVFMDFLLKLYGDNTPVESFKPSCLKTGSGGYDPIPPILPEHHQQIHPPHCVPV